MCVTAPNGHSGIGNGRRNGIEDSNAKRNHENGKKLTECLLGVSLPLWCSVKYQANEPNCRTSALIVSTTIVYGILYAVLRHYSGFLQPPLSSWQVVVSQKKNLRTISAAADASAAEWRSRLLATGNALLLIVGSILCFMEWIDTYVPESEGWVKTLPFPCETNDMENSNCSCFQSNPITFASLFVGYLQWDMCWLIWHRTTHPDLASMIHHTVFIGVTHFVLSGTYFRKAFAWLSFAELSTPFLHARWFLAATGQKQNGGGLYFWMSLGFAVTFLLTRAVGYGLGLVDIWWNRRSWGELPGLWGVVIGLHLSYGLNLFWSAKVGSALLRTISSGRRRDTKATLVGTKAIDRSGDQ